jgi:hypothetical protein
VNEQPWPPPSAPNVNAAFKRAATGEHEQQQSAAPPEKSAGGGNANDNPRLVLNPPGMRRAAPGPAPSPPRQVDPERLARIEKMRQGLRAKEEPNKSNEQGRTR